MQTAGITLLCILNFFLIFNCVQTHSQTTTQPPVRQSEPEWEQREIKLKCCLCFYTAYWIREDTIKADTLMVVHMHLALLLQAKHSRPSATHSKGPQLHQKAQKLKNKKETCHDCTNPLCLQCDLGWSSGVWFIM